MDPATQKLVNELCSAVAGKPLASIVLLAISAGRSIVKTTFYAAYDAIIARIWTNIILRSLNVVLSQVNIKIYLLVHLYVIYRRAYFQDFFRFALRLLARDGADDDNVYDVTTSVCTCLIYGIELLVITNFSVFYTYLQAWLPFLSTVVATVVATWTVAVHLFNMPMLAPILKLYEILSVFASCFLRFAPLIGQAVIALYAYTGQAFKKYYAVRARLLGDNKPTSWGQPYVYSQLSNGKSIRLLRVSRRGPFGDYVGEIVHTTLDKAPVFEAISYHWGDPTLDSKLMINGRALEVTSKVVAIVQSRASFIDKKLLWIDSVCINQSDPVEKSAQILLMKDIYRGAEKVLVWMGTNSDAFQANGYMSRLRNQLMWSTDQQKREKLARLFTNDGRESALSKFLDHPWWTRTWVVQEIAVAKKVVISYGDEYISWFHLESFLHLVSAVASGSATALMSIDHNTNSNIMVPSGVLQLPLLTQVKDRYYSDGAPYMLNDLLQLTRRCEVSDPRDKVYALLGLCAETNEPLLVPDYTRSVAEVFSSTARYLCGHDTLATLAFAGVGHSCQIASLPSWAPDFSSLQKGCTLHLTSTSPTTPGAYNAAGTSEASCELHQTLPVFRTSCILFDSISILGPRCILLSGSTTDLITSSKLAFAGFSQIVEFIRSNIGNGTYPFTGQPCDEVIWRVKVGDRCPTDEGLQRPASDVYGQYFDTLSREMTTLQKFIDILEASNWSDDVAETFPRTNIDSTVTAKFAEATGLAGEDRRVAMTQQGAVCLVPLMSQVGDVIGVMKGAQACTTLRKQAIMDVTKGSGSPFEDSNSNSQHKDGWTNPQWRFVGNCYVHGFMDGEALSTGQQWGDVYIW